MGERMISAWVLQRLFFLWVTFSMLLCAVLFLPWFLPRETVCGMMGRWKMTETGWKRAAGEKLSVLFDRTIHRAESCITVYGMEREARRILYVRGELDGLE